MELTEPPERSGAKNATTPVLPGRDAEGRISRVIRVVHRQTPGVIGFWLGGLSDYFGPDDFGRNRYRPELDAGGGVCGGERDWDIRGTDLG